MMLVLDKPAGIAVHAGPKGGASLEDDFEALRFGLPRRPALAHRLDRDTAGCLVLGRHHKALEHWGSYSSRARSPRPIGRSSLARPKATRNHRSAARPARRQARLVDEGRSQGPKGGDALARQGAGEWRGAPIAWLELEPKTGTHPSIARPLRVARLANLWAMRSTASAPTSPCQLLARKIAVPLSKSKPPIEVEAPAPAAHAGGAGGLRLCGGRAVRCGGGRGVNP